MIIKTADTNILDKVIEPTNKNYLKLIMKSQQAIVSLSVELNENIYHCMQDFLASNPQWNRKKLIDASISLFLRQSYQTIKPNADRDFSKIYLRSISNVQENYSQN